MTSVQDTYAQTLRGSQDAVVDAFERWTDIAKDGWAASPGGAGTPEMDPHHVIDQVFDLAEKMLARQCEFARSLAANAASATQTAREHSESVLGAVRNRAEDATEEASGKATDHWRQPGRPTDTGNSPPPSESTSNESRTGA